MSTQWVQEFKDDEQSMIQRHKSEIEENQTNFLKKIEEKYGKYIYRVYVTDKERDWTESFEEINYFFTREEADKEMEKWQRKDKWGKNVYITRLTDENIYFNRHEIINYFLHGKNLGYIGRGH